MISPLDRITAEEESRTGAKAYNCARLRQAGFRVPDGLVVLSTATAGDLAALANHPWLDEVPAETLFAVRSSGIGEDSDGQSFAGIHRTTLNVRRADLGEAVAACYASARSTEALEYRRAKGISTDAIQMGVLIQRMIQPVAAGVAFTVNPVTGADNEIVINASWGVGEALVSGQVDPDEFVVRKQDGELLWSRIGEKGNHEAPPAPSLTTNQVRELATILIDLERHYGAPQDVEWCHDGKEFWVVQSRPVTTAAARADEIEWTRANLAEVLPDVTSPQALSAFEDLLNRAERRHLGNLMAPEAQLGTMVKSFCGRLYFNLSQMRHVCAIGGEAPAVMLRSVGHADAIQPIDEVPAYAPIARRLACLPDVARILWQHLRAAHIVREHDARIRSSLSRLAVNPRDLQDAELWAVIEEWRRELPDWMQLVFLLSGVMFHEAPVRKVCEKSGYAFERLVYPQLATGERSVSAQQAFDLLALADTARGEPAVVQYLSDETIDPARMRVALQGTAFLASFDRFLEAYGHRGRYESDWSLPRYREDPTPLLHALRAHLEGRMRIGPRPRPASASGAREAPRPGPRSPRGSRRGRNGSRCRASGARFDGSSATTCGASRCAPMGSGFSRSCGPGISSWRTASSSAGGWTTATTISCCASKRSLRSSRDTEGRAFRPALTERFAPSRRTDARRPLVIARSRCRC